MEIDCTIAAGRGRIKQVLEFVFVPTSRRISISIVFLLLRLRLLRNVFYFFFIVFFGVFVFVFEFGFLNTTARSFPIPFVLLLLCARGIVRRRSGIFCASLIKEGTRNLFFFSFVFFATSYLY